NSLRCFVSCLSTRLAAWRNALAATPRTPDWCILFFSLAVILISIARFRISEKTLRRADIMLLSKSCQQLLILSVFALILLVHSGRNASQPSPQIPSATPYPTPVYNPASYLPPLRTGRTATVRGPNLADKIQAAQDDPNVTAVRIEGGGPIEKQ